MTAEPMTRADRETLLKIAKQRERLAKTEAKDRAAQMVADFERMLDRKFSYDENEVWERATLAATEAVKQAKALIAAECDKLGIPREFAPTLSMGWHRQGQNASKDRRIELRRIAARTIEAAERSARTAIERKSLETQERIMVGALSTEDARTFLEAMPRAEELMPMLTVERVENLLTAEKEAR